MLETAKLWRRESVERWHTWLHDIASSYGLEARYRIAEVICPKPFAHLTALDAVQIKPCIAALLNLDVEMFPLDAYVGPTDSPERWERELYAYVSAGMRALTEAASVAAAVGELPICGTWQGLDTVVRPRPFFVWAFGAGYYVPAAIEELVSTPEAWAKRQLLAGKSAQDVATGLKDKFGLIDREICDILRPDQQSRADKDKAAIGRKLRRGYFSTKLIRDKISLP